MDFIDFFDDVIDTRSDINKAYELKEILFLVMAAVLSGADGWKTIEIFGHSKIEWLRTVMPFKSGIPTRHTIGRIVRGVSANILVDSAVAWVNKQRKESGQEQIAFDGKTLKGSKNRHADALHLMSAMAVESGVVLYQSPSESKKNEIKTMQSMLEIVPIKGHIISADAMHCQKETASIIIEKKADYVLQIKKNQGNLLKNVEAFLHKTARDEKEVYSKNRVEDLDGEHGRITKRVYRAVEASEWIDGITHWSGAKSIVEVTREQLSPSRSIEKSYYLSSLNASEIKKISTTIRNHWKIESMHWILDVTFREDESKIYQEDGAKNMALFRRMLTNLIKAHPFKDSVAAKRNRACWDDKFRAEILLGHKMFKV